MCLSFFFQAEDGIRDHCVTGVQTCALPISPNRTFYPAGTDTLHTLSYILSVSPTGEMIIKYKAIKSQQPQTLKWKH